DSRTQPSTVVTDHGRQFADTSTYLVSSALLNSGVELCAQCDFMRWGTWGGQVNFRDGYGPWAQSVTADVNLGWYVAGGLTDVIDVDALSALGGSAKYTGGVVGNVASFQQGAWATYV